MLKLSTQIHKWLALVVGLQVLGWVVGGLLMTAIPIERVRSEHHIAKVRPAALPAGGVLDHQAAAAAIGVEAVEATLKTTLLGAVWVLKDAEGRAHVVDAGGRRGVAPLRGEGAGGVGGGHERALYKLVCDAATGRRMTPMPEQDARRFAGAQYQGRGRPVAARWFATAPQEAGKPGPLWRVDFNDAEKTSFYLSPDTGEVVSRRSNVWRLYDAFWRIHILDFKTGDDFNNPLIIAAAALTLPVVATGLILLWIRLGRDWKSVRARPRKARAPGPA